MHENASRLTITLPNTHPSFIDYPLSAANDNLLAT